MSSGANDAELWMGICQRLAPVFAEVFQKFPDIGPLVFLDTETDGLEDGGVIELGAISVSANPDASGPLFPAPDVLMGHFWELMDPGGARVSPFAMRIHGITPEMLRTHGAPAGEALRRFAEWVEWAAPKNLVAHNAAFDRGMLRAAFARHGVAWRLPEFLCTVKMAKGLAVPNRKLGTLARHFGCDNRQAHRSITDAEVCAYVFARMALMGRVVSSCQSSVSRKRSRPAERRGSQGPSDN
jgi:DNA polymerase III epsilon subunit-like protein